MERRAFRLNGFLVLLVLLVLAGGAAAVSPQVLGIGWIVLFVLVASGFTVVNPNEARVVQFFGRYIGTIRDAGLPLDAAVQHQDARSRCGSATSSRPGSRSPTPTATRSRSPRWSSTR